MNSQHFQPLPIYTVSQVLTSLEIPWAIAGGEALDLFIGKKTRTHADIDVLILRKHQSQLQEHLSQWDLQAADPPGFLRKWKSSETLPENVHVIWARKDPLKAWQIEFMLQNTDGEQWTYRRNPKIRGPLAELFLKTNDGISYLAPEIQLLYKSKDIRDKDELDFKNVLPHLNLQRKEWLKSALGVEYGKTHPWLSRL